MKIVFIKDNKEFKVFDCNFNFQNQIEAFFYVKNNYKIKPKSFFIGNYDFGQFCFVKTDDMKNFDNEVQINHEVLYVVDEYLMYEKAINFAIKNHKEQKYADGMLPYFYHLRQVDKVIDYFYNELPINYYFKLKISAILHDTIEDTEVKKSDIVSCFGEEIAEIVDKVSKNNLSDRALTDKIYFEQMKSNPYTIMVKIADKCANFKQTKKNMAKWHVKRVYETYEPFVKATYDKVELQNMKLYLANIVKIISQR
ncbi:MAG: GTP pyrophosphokinase rsh [Alphaproteobacteria bacterium ADurb.Bin438]|nr:MAG: GTP pyrophosphokinase rsh [Alphaproteobacteria bacterium ADurb.Bin438]